MVVDSSHATTTQPIHHSIVVESLPQVHGSPMFSFYHECFAGAATLRAFGGGKGRAATCHLNTLVANRNRAYFYMTAVQQFGAM